MEKVKWTKRLSSSIMTKVSDILEKDYESDEIQVAEYYLEALIMSSYKIPILFFIAYKLNVLYEIGLVFLLVGFMRKTSWGVHLKSGLGCLLFTMGMMFLNVYLSIYISFNIIFVFLILLISFYNYYKYAPADTEERPCLDAELRKEMKKKTLFKFFLINIANFTFFEIYKSDIIFDIVWMSIFMVSLMIHPLTYKILKRGYNNYEKYS